MNMKQTGIKFIFSLFQFNVSFHGAFRRSGSIASNGRMFGGCQNAKDLEGSGSKTVGELYWLF